MNINSILKKEGISVIGQLNTLEINKIASSISAKLCKAFPEHSLDQSNLFIAIARLNMYVANMPHDNAFAKYCYFNDSIYFNQKMDLNNLNDIALHECIHYLQGVRKENGKLARLGLYDLDSFRPMGEALNEAAVQEMASVAVNTPTDTVRYYNMDFSTNSPDYYPVETAIINQMTFFTGTYPLYHSTLYSNDIFKNTFIAKTSSTVYDQVVRNLDQIMEYENNLSKVSYKLSVSSIELRLDKVKKYNSMLHDIKEVIKKKTLETQELILTSCFNNSLAQVRTLEDINEIQGKLADFKNVLITTDDYNYYDEYALFLSTKLEEKKSFIEKYGNILQMNAVTHELANVEQHSYGYTFFKNLFKKMKLLFEEKIREKDF